MKRQRPVAEICPAGWSALSLSQNRQNRMPSYRERGIPKNGPRKRKVPMSDSPSHSQILGLQAINQKTSEPDFGLQKQVAAASRHNG